MSKPRRRIAIADGERHGWSGLAGEEAAAGPRAVDVGDVVVSNRFMDTGDQEVATRKRDWRFPPRWTFCAGRGPERAESGPVRLPQPGNPR
jgi:hypothetical protein